MRVHKVGPLPLPAGAWDLDDGSRVIEVSQNGEPARLQCMNTRCVTTWCRHCQAVIAGVLDAPLLPADLTGRVIMLEIQPTQDFYVPTVITRDDEGDGFSATFRSSFLTTPSVVATITFSDFFPSDGRLALREMFVQYLKSQDKQTCTAKVHPVLRSRKPKNLHDTWSMVMQSVCLECSTFLDTQEDVPDIKFHRSPSESYEPPPF